MLTKYKHDYAKIAMGFLSFIPDLKDMDHLKTELTLYNEEPNHVLYLYREARDADFEGIVGVESGSDFVMLRHLSFSPSVRNQETEFAALADLYALYPDKKIMGSLETAPLIAKFNQHRKEAIDGTDTGA
ncbi:MAG: N-acetyltransferase [Lactobacillus sp.]|jgi:riboflavin biosynthesis RibT protein|nr:N-acetyltransferase [Lactobacillus sp.]MCI2033675.1 N-acetyltransferase [Lactobacillus sp.]